MQKSCLMVTDLLDRGKKVGLKKRFPANKYGSGQESLWFRVGGFPAGKVFFDMINRIKEDEEDKMIFISCPVNPFNDAEFSRFLELIGRPSK